jgi:hypothetical protein
MAWPQAGDYRARPKKHQSEGRMSKNWRVQRHRKAQRAADLRLATPSSLPWNRQDPAVDPDYRHLDGDPRAIQPARAADDGAPPATAWRKATSSYNASEVLQRQPSRWTAVRAGAIRMFSSEVEGDMQTHMWRST